MFQRPLTLILLQKHRDTDGVSRYKLVVCILLSAKRRAYFCRSIAIEMGGVSRYFSKVSGSGVDWTLLYYGEEENTAVYKLFRKVRANFCPLPCDMSQEPNGNRSEKHVQMNYPPDLAEESKPFPAQKVKKSLRKSLWRSLRGSWPTPQNESKTSLVETLQVKNRLFFDSFWGVGRDPRRLPPETLSGTLF